MKLASDLVRPWSGVIFRAAHPRWAASPDMLSGLGGMKSGARFNAPDSFPAVYGSTTPELAMIETLAFQRRAGLPVERAMPLVFKAISVEVERCLDLTNSNVLSVLALSTDEIRTEAWWLAQDRGEESLTQAVGRSARVCGIEALSAASAHAANRGVNLIVLPDCLTPPSQFKVLRRPRSSPM